MLSPAAAASICSHSHFQQLSMLGPLAAMRGCRCACAPMGQAREVAGCPSDTVCETCCSRQMRHDCRSQGCHWLSSVRRCHLKFLQCKHAAYAEKCQEIAVDTLLRPAQALTLPPHTLQHLEANIVLVQGRVGIGYTRICVQPFLDSVADRQLPVPRLKIGILLFPLHVSQCRDT